MKNILFFCFLTGAALADDLDYGVARLEWMGMDDVDMDAGGTLSYDRFTLQSGLSKPKEIAVGIKVFPAFRYTYTDVNFSDAAFREFNDLHQLEFPFHFFREVEGNPWVYDFKIMPGIASDMVRVKSNDFYTELNAGAIYRFSEKFSANFGLAYTRLTGSPTFLPYAGFDWQPNEAARITLHGAAFDARYQFANDWQLRLNARSAGGLWNVDTVTFGNSKYLDLSSYRAAISVERRIKNELWIYAGAGVTLGNQVELRDKYENTLYTDAADGGMFIFAGLRLGEW